MAPKPPAFGAPRQKAVALAGLNMGAPRWPPNPQRSERPGKSRGARWSEHGGPEMAPKPPAFGAPRQSRGARWSEHGGPEMAPKPPAFGAPRQKPWRSSTHAGGRRPNMPR